MKKILGVLLLLAGLSGLGHAYDFELIPDRTVVVNYTDTLATIASTNTVMIDLSDTTNWPHTRTKAILISAIRINVDKAAATICTVRVGVVNFVNNSTGSVTWFHTWRSDVNVSNTGVTEYINYQPSYINALVNDVAGDVDGSTPYIFSGDVTSGNTAYQKDLVLNSTYASGAAPGRGDIIVKVDKTNADALRYSVQILYSSRDY